MFDFGRYSAAISAVMDTDYIDIRRNVAGALTEIYSNIPCHVSYSNTDNPDPTTVDVKPVITSLSVNMGNWVDVENDDFIVAKKMGADGNVQSVYSGRCGEPTVSQGRKKVSVAMRGTEAAEPTPVPPKDYVEITVRFFVAAETDPETGAETAPTREIQDAVVIRAAANAPYEISAREIEGYAFVAAYVDGLPVDGDTVRIDDTGETAHDVAFEYTAHAEAEWMRYLVNGLYTKDGGAMANGWHLYKRIRVNSVTVNDGEYVVECARATLTHEETSERLSLQKGTRLVLIPGFTYLEVEEAVVGAAGATFTAREFTPTDAQRAAYVCGYYDD